MTAVGVSRPPVAPRLAVMVAGAAGAIGLAAAVAHRPEMVVLAAVVAAGAWFLLPRLTLATATLGACFFYDDYFTDHFGFWNPGKLLGILAVGCFAYAWATDRRPIVWSSQLWVLGGLSGALAVSYTFSRDAGAAQQAGIRYVMFFVLYFLVLQAIRTRDDIDWILDVTVAGATVAAAIGLGNFFVNSLPRVQGPLSNPGDFGFLLGSTLPVILYRASTSSGVARALRTAAGVVVVAAILGTFARADVLGLLVAAAWSMATGRLRVRWLVIACVTVLAIVAVAFRFEPDLIESNLAQKQHVAQKNIDSRFGLWGVAVDEWLSAPVFGVGPGNFQVRFPEFRSPFELRVETTHNAYLNVLAELGSVGLALFSVFLVQSWLVIRRRASRADDHLRTALGAGFLVALVGAFFMTQQFYPPLWFLAAVGTALNRIEDRPPTPAVEPAS